MVAKWESLTVVKLVDCWVEKMADYLEFVMAEQMVEPLVALMVWW